MLATLAVITLLAGEPFLRTPDVAGDKVAFSCEGDLWIGSITSGTAARLTNHEGRETAPRFSPDGKSIAFSGEYDGIRELYVIPVEGSGPRRLTFLGDNAEPLDWTPDGKTILFKARGIPVSSRLYTISADGGFPKRLPIEFAHSACFLDSSNRIAFTRFPRASMNWFNYDGGRVNQVWVGDLSNLSFSIAVSNPKGSCEYPVYAGGMIWMATDPDGKFGLSKAPLRTSAVNSVPVGDRGLEEISNLGSDGKSVVYQRGTSLVLVDSATGKQRDLDFELTSDVIHTRPYSVAADRSVESTTIGPTGKRALVVSRGQIVSLAAKEGEARIELATPGVRYRLACWSPDSKSLAYVSDETREHQVYVATSDGGNPKQLTKDSGRQICSLQWSSDGKLLLFSDSEGRARLVDIATGTESLVYDLSDPWKGVVASFSPDSKWIAFEWVEPVTSYYSLGLYEIPSKKTTVLGRQLASDFSPCFSQDGKWLAFLSRRNIVPTWDEVANSVMVRNSVRPYLLALRTDIQSPFLPKNDEESGAPSKDPEKPKEEPFRIDLDGLYERLIEVPATPRNYSRVAVAGNRLILQYQESDGRNVAYYDLADRSQGSISDNVPSFDVSADGKKVLLQSGNGLRIVDSSAANVPPSPTVSFGGLQLQVDPRKEWEQIYWDAWRLHRDYFYVKNMNGADWPAVGRRYSALLPRVRSRDELDEIIRWMQAELSVSHAFISPGDTRSLFRASPPAFLGIDVEPDASGYYRIARILTGDGYDSERSPLAAPGLNVNVGDFLIEVAGVTAKVGSDFLRGLVGRSGQTVSIKVNSKGSPDGARKLYIKPIASERNLRYKEWVKANAEYVNRSSSGRIAYLHLQNMGTAEFGHFLAQYLPQRNREALIVDVRFNSGGNISDHVNRVLKQKFVAMWNQRAAIDWSRQQDSFLGPKVCLINEFCYSDGELFPDQFQQDKVGPLIGRRTSAAEVGSDPGWPLVDGAINVPNYAAWRPGKGWIIESSGVIPDLDVPSDPNAFARGRDPQLDRAITYLLDEMKRNPVVRPKQPPDPVRVRGGS